MRGSLYSQIGLAIVCAMGSLLGTSASAATLWMNDFESGTGALNSAPGGLAYAVVSNPSGTGNVLSLTRTANGSQFSEVRTNGGSGGVFAFSPSIPLAGGDTFRMAFDIFIPANTKANGLTAVFRVRDSGSTNFTDFGLGASNYPGLSTFDAPSEYDQWLSVVITGTIPVTFGSGFTATNVTPIIAWRQTTFTGTDSYGIFGYLDNISVTTAPEPSRAMLLLGGGVFALCQLRSRKRFA